MLERAATRTAAAPRNPCTAAAPGPLARRVIDSGPSLLFLLATANTPPPPQICSNVVVQRALTDLVPIVALLALRLAVDVVARLVRPKVPKKTEREQMAEKYGAHRAREYNVPQPEGST